MKRLHIVPAMARDVVLEVIRRKEMYVVLILGGAIVLLLGSARFFGGVEASSHVKETAIHLVLLFTMVLAILVSARQIPGEHDRRTLFTLLAKPVSRSRFIVGKWLGCFLGTALAATVFWILFLVMVQTKEGGALSVTYLQGYLFFLGLAAVCVSIALFFSTFLTQSANITICLLLCPAFLWWGRQIAGASAWADAPAPARFAVLNLVPHLEFFDLRTVLVYHWEPLSAGVVAAVLGYAVTYSVLLTAAACAVFARAPLVQSR